jgi:hypothetical protein
VLGVPLCVMAIGLWLGREDAWIPGWFREHPIARRRAAALSVLPRYLRHVHLVAGTLRKHRSCFSDRRAGAGLVIGAFLVVSGYEALRTKPIGLHEKEKCLS